jgi:membrane fusion protein (multidrug efflux system)
MKSKTVIIIIAIVAALVVIKLMFLKQEGGPSGKAGSQGQATNVTAYIVKPQELENKIFSSGTVMANEEVQLRPEISGKLISIFFKEGSYVTKGTLLAKIFDEDLKAQLKKLELQLKLAEAREKRLKGLLEIKGVSEEEYYTAENELATIATDMDYTKAQISKTEIVAPFSGKIGLKNVSEGSFVTNADVIATMQQLDLLKIDFTVPEKYASLIVVGDTVHFRVASSPDQFSAAVYAIEPRIDPQTRNITVRAIYRNSKTAIYPGAFAKIELIASKKQSSLLIPTEAVIPELNGTKIFICKNGKATPIKVETGTRTESDVDILSGITAGDTVITTGIMGLKPNTNVKIVSFNK